MTHQGTRYPTAEHAYQAAKCLDPAARSIIAALETPGRAKRSHDKLDLPGPLVPDWKGGPAQQAMAVISVAKYRQNPDLLGFLAQTGDAIIVESNTWHDNFWGDCTCPDCSDLHGHNVLGSILMAVRAALA